MEYLDRVQWFSKVYNLKNKRSKKLDFVIVNGENAADLKVWDLLEEICKDFFNCGVDVITTGNHVWDQKEIMEYIEKENRLLDLKIFLNQPQEKVFNIYDKKWI